MNTVSDAIDKARSDAQDLHKKLMAATGKDRAAIKADLNTVAAGAQQLAASLKQTAQYQEPNAQQYLNDAASLMQDAANHAKNAAQAAAPEFASAKSKVIADVSGSLNNLSHAVAAQRSAQQPARS